MTKPHTPDRPKASPSRATPHERRHARLMRQFDKLRRMLPWLDGWIRHLQSDRAALIRLPVALLLTFGGLLWFLPVFGLWMLPAGLMLLAIDIPTLQHPVSVWFIRARRWWARQRRARWW